MRPVSTCPRPKVLQQFRLGDLAESEADTIVRHLAECPACVQTVQALPLDDTLLDALRSYSGETIEQLHPREVEGLIERLLRVPGMANRDEEVTEDDPSRSTQSGAATATLNPGAGRNLRDLCDFLAPPQKADELGRLGAYRVLQVLGSGGMGVVFLAED